MRIMHDKMPAAEQSVAVEFLLENSPLGLSKLTHWMSAYFGVFYSNEKYFTIFIIFLISLDCYVYLPYLVPHTSFEEVSIVHGTLDPCVRGTSFHCCVLRADSIFSKQSFFPLSASLITD